MSNISKIEYQALNFGNWTTIFDSEILLLKFESPKQNNMLKCRFSSVSLSNTNLLTNSH